MHTEDLKVTAQADKSSYAKGEVPEFSVSVLTQAGEPVYAEIRWGLRVLPDGEWNDYSREFPVHTGTDDGNASWRYPSSEFGPIDSGDYEMSLEAYAYSDDGQLWGQGSAEILFHVGS
jgi:hypothetical protein